MGIEIERKFLVRDDAWMQVADSGVACEQGYLVSDEGKTVRVRVMGEAAFLTIKGASLGISRIEFEYSIPLDDAKVLLGFCGSRVEKIRYFVPYGGMTWELDVFLGDNAGLIVAEIELESEDSSFDLPDWAGREVSFDPLYYNSSLSRFPFCDWE